MKTNEIETLEKELNDAKKELSEAIAAWNFAKKRQYKAWEQSYEYPTDEAFTRKAQEWEKHEWNNVHSADARIKKTEDRIKEIQEKIQLLSQTPITR